MNKQKVGIIGVGKLGESLLRGLLKSKLKAYDFLGSDRHPERLAALRSDFTILENNRDLVKQSDILILAVKPQNAEEVLAEIQPLLSAKHLLFSVCASLSSKQITKWSGKKARVVRVMPNLPSLIQEGMSVIAKSETATKQDLQIAEELFSALGQTAILDESLFDGVTALSACGPAFIFLILEALSEAGVKVGIPREVATKLAAQTMKGSAQMVLETGKHPAALKDAVTTPAGCTIDGLMALEEGKIRSTLLKAVLASAKRSAEICSD